MKTHTNPRCQLRTGRVLWTNCRASIFVLRWVWTSRDQNGNLTNYGSRSFAYDDANQLIRVTESNLWSSGFVYDGKMRLRIRYESNRVNSTWTKIAEVRYIYGAPISVARCKARAALAVCWREPTITRCRRGMPIILPIAAGTSACCFLPI